jgi:hypothetical protein
MISEGCSLKMNNEESKKKLTGRLPSRWSERNVAVRPSERNESARSVNAKKSKRANESEKNKHDVNAWQEEKKDGSELSNCSGKSAKERNVRENGKNANAKHNDGSVSTKDDEDELNKPMGRREVLIEDASVTRRARRASEQQLVQVRREATMMTTMMTLTASGVEETEISTREMQPSEGRRVRVMTVTHRV